LVWTVSVEIPVNAPISPTTVLGTDVFELQMKLEKELGIKSVSSGCGFGYRDIQYDFETEEQAIEAVEKIANFLRKCGYTVAMYQEDEKTAFVYYYEVEEVEE